MKTLKFNFTHPFKGTALLNMWAQPNFLCKQFSFDSKGRSLIEILLGHFQNGKYNVTLSWEKDDRFPIYQHEFEVNVHPDFNPATL